jgi:proteasome accessory factor B
MSACDRLHRLLRLLELLQSGRVYNSLQLSEAIGVSRRTVFRDLRLLENAGLPVMFDDQRQGHLIRAQVLLPTGKFTLEETLSLLVLCHELGNSGQGIPFYRAAQSAAMKLMSNLPQRLRESTLKSAESISVRLDPHNPMPASKTVFETLSQALADRRQVRISYESLDEQKTISTLLSPYRLLFSRRSWFAIGRSSLHRQVRTFNVGRVLKAEVLDSSYRIPERFNLDRYLGNAWHLMREPRARHTVVVRFQPLVARNVSEVQWHKTQQLLWRKDGSLEFRATVDGLREIVWWILGYGSHAEVLKPAKLREMVRQHISALHQNYNGRSTSSKTDAKRPHYLEALPVESRENDPKPMRKR